MRVFCVAASALPVALALCLHARPCLATTNADLEQWSRGLVGVERIATAMSDPSEPLPLRAQAAQMLIALHHPVVDGYALFAAALERMPPAARSPLVHELVSALAARLPSTPSASAPPLGQVNAKDAAVLMLPFASATDRVTLGNVVLEWLLAGLNLRALAGQFSAEQIVRSIGPTALEPLLRAYRSDLESIGVVIAVSQLVASVATNEGRDAAAARAVAVAREVASPAMNDRLRSMATELLSRNAAAGAAPSPARLDRATETLRGQMLVLVIEALRVIARPAGTQYLLSVAADAAHPLVRRKIALAAVAGQVRDGDAAALLSIARGGEGADLELRGLAVDRLGELHDASLLPQLWGFFDAANGGLANDEDLFRWKTGEALLKIGGVAILPTFVQHLTERRRSASGEPTFAGYTFREIQGYALALGDGTPAHREALRRYLSSRNPYVRALALLSLGTAGEASDLARLDAATRDRTAMTAPGWSDAQAATLGAVASRARDSLRHRMETAAHAP